MNWTPEEIKKLRLQLGWSSADLGRRLGCGLKEVVMWETGVKAPELGHRGQLDHLGAHMNQNAVRTQEAALADQLIEEHHLAQVTADVLRLRSLD